MADKKKELFADGIGQIHYAGNMFRFDFVTLQPAEDGKAFVLPPLGARALFKVNVTT